MLYDLLFASLVFTGVAVTYGVKAFLADRRASPIERPTAPPRETPVSQSERLAEETRREVDRRFVRTFTYCGALWWLAASAVAAGASLVTIARAMWTAVAIAGVFITAAVIVHGAFAVLDDRWGKKRRGRIAAVEQLLTDARRPDRQMGVVEQLREWAGNADLRVFVQHKLQGPTRTTYQGMLEESTAGVGGWIVKAFDWQLGPVDSTSVFRGVALNLHFYDDCRRDPGNGVFSASCRFYRRDWVPSRLDDGRIDATRGIVEELTIMIDDPFEIMPFLGAGTPTATSRRS